jgi:hypothetical protein
MQKNNEGKWCWGTAGAEGFTGAYELEEEAHWDARHELGQSGEQGQTVQYEIARLVHPLALVTDGQMQRHIENLLEAIDESAYDEIGGDDPIFKFANKSDTLGLVMRVREFIRNNATVSRYGLKNITTHAFTVGAAGAGKQEGGAP